MFNYAITRKPAKNFADGLTTSFLGTPQYELIMIQHQEYVRALKERGLEVTVLDELDDHPDAYFVEDVALVTPEAAILTNPGAEVRKGEVVHIESTLAKFRKIERIAAPAEIEGGDVMCVEGHYFIGKTPRTNKLGAEQIGRILERYGYTWSVVPVPNYLHLKTAVNYIGNNTLLMTDVFAEEEQFARFDKIIVDEENLPAVNTLLVNGHLLTPKGYPRVKDKLLENNPNVVELDVSEVAKMDGGLSCLSLRF